MTGGTGFDNFIFKGRTDTDVIRDFETGVDDIDLQFYGITNLNKFINNAVSYANGNAYVDLDYAGGNGEIIVLNVNNLDQFDFIV